MKTGQQSVISYGVKMMWVASFCFAIMNVLVKKIPNIPPVEIVLFRSVISLAICVAAIKRKKISFWGSNKKMLIARGVFGAIALILFFYTLQVMPLATATTIHYLSPIFTTIIAFLVLKERMFRIQWLFFAISFSGILLIKGFDHQIALKDLLIGIGAALASGGAYNCIRYLKNTENPYVVILYFPLVTIPIVGVISYFNWVMPVGVEWLYLLAIGILTQFVQISLTKAYQAEDASTVSAANYVGIFFAILFGYWFFDDILTGAVISGIAVVLTGVVLNLTFKRFVKAEN